MSTMRTRGQKLKQQQLGQPASPPLQLATPPRRPRAIKKVPPHSPENNKQSLDNSSEIIFNFNYFPPSPKTPPRSPIALDEPSTEDPQTPPNGSPEIPIVLDASLIATDGAASIPIVLDAPLIATDDPASTPIVLDTPLIATDGAASIPTVLDAPLIATDDPASTPIVIDTPLIATDGAASIPIQTGAPATVPALSQTILHLWLDAAQEDLVSARPGSDPSIAMALPSALIPNLMHYISRLANSTGTNTLTLNASSVGISPRQPRSNKRKLGEDAEDSQAAQGVQVETSQKPKRQKKRGVFSRMPLEDLDFTPTTVGVTPPNSHGPATTFTRESLYSKDGSLQLGLVATSRIVSTPTNETIIAQPIEAEVEQTNIDERIQPAEETLMVVNEEALMVATEEAPMVATEEAPMVATEEAPMVAQTPTQNQPVEETPRAGRWGFGGFLKSARSVSKFLPGFQRAPLVPTPVVEDNANDPNPHLDPTPPAVDRSAINVETMTQSTATQTMPLENSQPIEPQGIPEIEDSRRRMTNQPNKSSKTGFQAHQERADRDRNLGASKSKAPESFTGNKKSSTPGTKRKRLPSPDTIPNPVGCSYGMDLDYFGYSSSEEEDEVITPTQPRPSKHRRLCGPDMQGTVAQVDTVKARSYRGGFVPSGNMNYEGGNDYNVVTSIESSNLSTEKPISENPVMRTQQSVSRTPITNPTRTFRVPSPSDSDSDPEDTPTELARNGHDVSYSTSASPKKPSPRVEETSQTASCTSKGNTSRTQSSPIKAVTLSPKKAPTTWTQPPPPRPNPPHAALPPMSSADSEALARARKKALHYQPHKPSGLRASSRISSPRILEDKNVAVKESNKTWTNQTGTSGDIDTALAVRSENAVASKLGQTDTFSNSERGESSSEKEVPSIATKENTTSLDVVESAPSSYVRDPQIEACLDAFWKDENTKQAADTFEGLYAAFLTEQ